MTHPRRPARPAPEASTGPDQPPRPSRRRRRLRQRLAPLLATGRRSRLRRGNPKGGQMASEGATQKRGAGAGRGWLRGLGGQASTKTNTGRFIKRWPSAARGDNDPTPAADGLRVRHSKGRRGRAQRITNDTSNNHLSHIRQSAQGFTYRNRAGTAIDIVLTIERTIGAG